ncbi:hypothetical protein [Aliiroseovarius sp. F20344]|uniref:hypothetical protein n=1 Tax=Aliiroseovarius sp. F20344 TaxID=2926414 RepID=UPI001FF515D8|nr:hypothetical protein [Aliiroseovarius sp. F20344]MCK0143135.1 hypothetical protein [Aliiroseovarius sp. F20344]
MRTPREPLFLARQSYRKRRIEDAARLLPLLGVILFLLPLMVGGEVGSMRLAYVFTAWFLLIFSAGILSFFLGQNLDQDASGEDTGRPESSGGIDKTSDDTRRL